jgi:crotonobetainyl-CoA:carnitine CoA-transferase CaiB-like acyl-CoA transferase
MHTCGQADGPPTWLGVALGDIVSGMNAANAISLALFQRERTGVGQYIDVSMYDTIVALADRSVNAYALAGDVLQRGRELYMAPWGPFECSDGWVALIVATERDWGRFCTAIGRPDLETAEGATSGPERARNMDGELGATIRAWFAERTREDATERLLAAGLPIGPVQTAEDIHACPQIAARELIIDVPDPVIGSARLVGPPFKMSGNTTPIARPAPALGEHNDEVLAALGHDAEHISDLREAGVI